MLVTRAADIAPVLHRALVTVSFVCCALVIASFTLFAVDQISGASKHQQNELSAGVAATPGPAAPKKKAQPRRFIDGVAGTLTSPFSSIVESSNGWVEHGLPAVFALIVYGLGIGYVARFSRGRG